MSKASPGYDRRAQTAFFMQLCSAAWYSKRQQLDRSNLAPQNRSYGASVREWTDCGRLDEEGYDGAPQRNELRSMMCREGDDKPVVCVLEGEDRHLEGEDCKIVVPDRSYARASYGAGRLDAAARRARIRRHRSTPVALKL